MKQIEQPVFVVCAVLAIACYASSLLGHTLPTSAAPLWLRHHANGLATLGGLCLCVELWLGTRLRKALQRRSPVAHL